MSKTQLRHSIKAVLAKIPDAEIASQSSHVLHRIKELPEFSASKNVALFMNMPHSEIQTLPIIKECFKQGKNVFLPQCIFNSAPGRKKNHMLMIGIPSYDDVLSLEPRGKYKLLEPTAGVDAFTTGLDVVILPGVAFTKELHRLGHGAGFYDEFLTVYKKKFGKTPYLIGVALKEQIVSQLPIEEHDWPLDALVVADEVYMS